MRRKATMAMARPSTIHMGCLPATGLADCPSRLPIRATAPFMLSPTTATRTTTAAYHLQAQRPWPPGPDKLYLQPLAGYGFQRRRGRILQWRFSDHASLADAWPGQLELLQFR